MLFPSGTPAGKTEAKCRERSQQKACWERGLPAESLLGNEVARSELKIETILRVPSRILLGTTKPFPARTCWERAFPAAPLLGTLKTEGGCSSKPGLTVKPPRPEVFPEYIY